MRTNPHLLEINARTWLAHLRSKYNHELTLSEIPEAEWQSLKRLGFDAVWLMGVWTPSAVAGEIARKCEPILSEIRKVNPDFKPEDVVASPYAIYDYTLNPALGRPDELAVLHEKLNSLGLDLILDFVSNHLALDHKMVAECPECFIHGSDDDAAHNPEFFFKGPDGKTWFAHGRDPNFAPWKDTVQLNYFCPRAREYMLQSLMKVANVCDGVRCDMAMLALNDIHRETWGWLLNRQGYTEQCEFWREAVSEVKNEFPLFTFLAEVYWGLEWRMQEMGFDYTYDKVLYDRLRQMGAPDVRGHLNAESLYQKRSLRFIENHDEPAALAAFGLEKSISAAIIMSTLRGMRLYNQTQITGGTKRVPVQYLKCDYTVNPEVARRYEQILKVADDPAFHGGEWSLIDVNSAAHDDSTCKNILAWSWNQQRTVKYVIVNYSGDFARARIPIKPPARGNDYTFYDELSDRFFTRETSEIKEKGLYIELPPYSSHLLDLEF
ncbi:MAG: alpha-amylase family glycosyl hydrolase [Elusimicrobiaceae bacterium]|jgi:hypothetical protein